MAIYKSSLMVIVASVLLTLSLAFANGLPTEIVEGSCKDFNMALAKGVKPEKTDGDDKREPKRAGVTRASTTWKAGVADSYDGQKDEHCSTIELKKSPIDMTQIRRYLQWKPSSTPSKACSLFLAQWTKQVIDHEDKHRDDNLEILAEYQKSWKPITFQKCLPQGGRKDADITPETTEVARAAAEAHMKKILEQMSKDIKERAAKFHDTPEGGPTTPLDCNLCKVKGDE